jgi:hypothetical protein
VTVTGTAHVEPPPQITPFDNKSLAGMDAFDNVDAVLASALDPGVAVVRQTVRISGRSQ